MICNVFSLLDVEVTDLLYIHHFKTTIDPDVLPTTTNTPKQSTQSTETSVPSTEQVPSEFTANCGEVDTHLALIKFGRPINNGEFPWLVAMFYYENKIKQYTFRCASTLVSKKFVITGEYFNINRLTLKIVYSIAAHCVKIDQNLLKKEFIVLVLGKHNLNSWLSGTVISNVEEIYIHPDYNSPADGDIAILQMSSPVEYTSTIKPACLWSEDKNMEQIFGLKGRALGWGKDENNNETVDVARQLEMPITSNENCLRSDVRFFSVTSNRTFCAGTYLWFDFLC